MREATLQSFQAEFPATSSTVEGADWAWRDTDPGSDRLPVLFLPGAGGTGDVFYKAVYALRGQRRVITLRYPALSDVAKITSGLAGLLDALGVRRVDIAASSLGGYVAQALTFTRPGLVRRLLLGNTFFDASWLQAKVAREAVLATPAEEHLARTVAQLEGLPDNSAEQRDFKATMLALVGPEQTGEMARASLAAVLGAPPLAPINLPADAIAVLDTDDDAVVDADTRNAVRRRYASSARHTLASGGHYPSLLNPTAYNDAVRLHFAGS